MIDSIELFLVGLSCVFDIALFLILFDKINKRQVPLWLKVLVGSAAIYHISYFFRLVIQSSGEPLATYIDRTLMVTLSVGLLVMPSALLHASIRLNHTGREPQPAYDLRYLFIYVPVLLICWVSFACYFNPNRVYLETVKTIKPFYLICFAAINLMSAIFFYPLRHKLDTPAAKPFFGRLIPLILMITTFVLFYGMLSPDHFLEPILRVVISTAPLLIASLFVWHTLKQSLLPLIMERTIFYGGVIFVAALLHRLFITPIATWVETRYGIDLLLLEAILVGVIIWSFPNLRARVSESMRFLLSGNAFHLRDSIREISRSLSRHIDDDLSSLCHWFAQELQNKLEVRSATIWIDKSVLNKQDDDCCFFQSISDSIKSTIMITDNPPTPSCSTSSYLLIIQRIQQYPDRTIEVLNRGELMDEPLQNDFEQTGIAHAFKLQYGMISGVVFLGNRIRSDRFADEQLTSLRVIMDQFAAILQNRVQAQLRLNAERHSMQQEKLSTVGLISGALAHELRNPLSSIRTLATLVSEELAADERNVEDLQLIIQEVDRLHKTSEKLLDFARPGDDSTINSQPDKVICKLLQVMSYLAKHHHVSVNTYLNAESIAVDASEIVLSEIFINLLKNAIEAAADKVQGSGVLSIESQVEHDLYCVKFMDNGNGIEPAVYEKLFQPFVTSKQQGTGLGLYIVAERIALIGGKIDCKTKINHGTTFTVKLPLSKSSAIPRTIDA